MLSEITNMERLYEAALGVLREGLNVGPDGSHCGRNVVPRAPTPFPTFVPVQG